MIAIIGCGRVGLPLALFLTKKGLNVIGIDTDQERVNTLRAGEMPFYEKDAEKLLCKAISSGLLTIENDFSKTSNQANIFIITVGTSLNNNMVPEQHAVLEIIKNILSTTHRGQITIILRSTVTPGTSQYILRLIKKENISVGKNVLYAYCPERIAEGKALEELGSQPQIVGTFDDNSQQKVTNFFNNLGIQCITGTPTEAELAKIFNNMYRYVNFALANQCMYLTEKYGGSTVKVLQMCNENYKRGGPWQPGYAAGPCLSKDGFFLTNQQLFIDLIFSSWKINESLPAVLLKEAEQIRPLKNVALLGLAFKAESDDSRNSLGLKLLQLLKGQGANVKIHDPYVKFNGACKTLQETLTYATEVFVMVPHKEYKELTLDTLMMYTQPHPLIVDPWFLWSKKVITVHTTNSHVNTEKNI
ncbi:MAG: nucleotide sugar dehydrogenase [Clostridia bacterium]|nr:nucleotide sugar dehydrogenase [Clostridia bacterium]MDD4047708.1 nucleotide sugar dehydrogenase [Clostridia bacterium]